MKSRVNNNNNDIILSKQIVKILEIEKFKVSERQLTIEKELHVF